MDKKVIADLRAMLLKLPATGEDGFEGLLAAVLAEISGVPFRLSGSGSQFGMDGKSAYEDDAICFEAKRYDRKIPKNEVITKIAELTIDGGSGVDLWVLGATTSVSTQLADNVLEISERNGISTLVLDWSRADLPALAVALAMAAETAAEFIGRSAGDRRGVRANALASLKAVEDDERFASHAARIRGLLREPTIGTSLAVRNNRRWLEDIFGSQQRAKRHLRQPLAPGDAALGNPLPRESLVSEMGSFLASRPTGKIAVIVGDEGNGKSWLFAQSWLSQADRPLMVVFTADEFSDAAAAGDVIGVLIDKLVAQTGGRKSESAVTRWLRTFNRWRKTETAVSPRLVVVIDGMNQRPQLDWARIANDMSHELGRMGGQLVLTTRTVHYSAHVKRRLIASTVVITVPEWTETERDLILEGHGIRVDELPETVATSLRNPRLLAIALELLQGSHIRQLEQLSISRLLFEHMRIYGERDNPVPRPAHEFARALREHAYEILKRIDRQQIDDLKVFDGGLEAVSDGRFFIQLEDDPTRYRLDESGLTLALGFAIVDELRTARRNGRDLTATIEAMIEPIASLDRTFDAVLAALTISCLDGDCPVEIGAAITCAFAGLQNPNADEFPAFCLLAEGRPDVFMQAARQLCLAPDNPSNFDWVRASLHAAKQRDSAWTAMIPILQSWLGHYSLAPEARMYSIRSGGDADKVEEERRKRQAEIEAKIVALSPHEKALLDELTRNDGDVDALAHLALALIAGKPVAPFSRALAHWSFAGALNMGFSCPYDQFIHLVRFNRVDWSKARDAIVEAGNVFADADVSRTGKWAHVNLLRATGDPAAALREQALLLELTADRPAFEGWRRVERYCASDPCDPESQRPDNITETAKDYAGIDVAKIRLFMGPSSDDLHFEDARPGLARFEPSVAIAKHREFIGHVISRKGLALRQGTFEMGHHNALLTAAQAKEMASNVEAGVVASAAAALKGSEPHFIAQYFLLAAFPLLSADEQVKALLSPYTEGNPLLSLLYVAKPLEQSTYEALLLDAIRSEDEQALVVLLAFAAHSDTLLSDRVLDRLPGLMGSEIETVRALTLYMILNAGDQRAIQSVVKIRWSAKNLDGRGGYEAWYGSHVILEAASLGMLTCSEALDRIAPALYGHAAEKLGGDAGATVARCIDASIRKAAGFELDVAVPLIEINQRREDTLEPARYHVSARPEERSDLTELMRDDEDENDRFEEQQRLAHAAFDVFKAELTTADAAIVLDRLRMSEFKKIAEADRGLAEDWADLFLGLPKARHGGVHNLGLLLAYAVAGWNPELAARLFETLHESEPYVTNSFGRIGLPLAGLALWSAPDHALLDAIRSRRLDSAINNDELALEVLTALWCGKAASLERYVEENLESGEPSRMARALMVTGLSGHGQENAAVLARYKGTPGFIGAAQSAAASAFERHAWAMHWHGKMLEAPAPEDFWRFSVLFLKVVDGRFDVFGRDDGAASVPYRLFWPGVESQLKNLYQRVRAKRKKKLFGEKSPEKEFLSPWGLAVE